MDNYPPIRTAEFVDLERFAGNWYVIANIPTFIEKDIFNAVEYYAPVDADGRVATTFSFNKGSFDGRFRSYSPTGFVRDDGSNAVWGMQFIWPIKAEYRILYVDPEYGTTIVGRTKRDYAWIMARTRTLPEERLKSLEQILIDEGYDLSALRYVPHSPEGTAETVPAPAG